MKTELQPELVEKVVERLKALADATRLRLIMRLRKGEANVSELSEEMGVSQASMSKHLSTLRQVGLIRTRREGTQAIYSIADEKVFDMCEIVCDGVIRHLHQQAASLQAAVIPRRGRTSTRSTKRRRGRPA